MSKQAKAFARASQNHAAKAGANPLLVIPANTAHHFDCERLRSFAAGWIAGVNYIRGKRVAKYVRVEPTAKRRERK